MRAAIEALPFESPKLSANAVLASEDFAGVNLDPDPWDAGAIAAILPELAASDIFGACRSLTSRATT
jgi:hypothetical protein